MNSTRQISNSACTSIFINAGNNNNNKSSNNNYYYYNNNNDSDNSNNDDSDNNNNDNNTNRSEPVCVIHLYSFSHTWRMHACMHA